MRGIRFPWAVLVLAASGASAFRGGAVAEVRLVREARGLSNPVHVTHAGDRSGRLFVVEQRGRIRIVRSGAVVPAPFLDIASRVTCCGSGASSRWRFLRGSPRRGASTSTIPHERRHRDLPVLRAGRDSRHGRPPRAKRFLLRIPQPYANHKRRAARVRPGRLPLRRHGRRRAPEATPQNHAQNPASLLGKIPPDRCRVRSRSVLDPAVESVRREPGVPAGDLGTRPRNPWRFSFDRRTSDLFIGDVGQNARRKSTSNRLEPGGRELRLADHGGTACLQPGQLQLLGLVPSRGGGIRTPAATARSRGASSTGAFVFEARRHLLLRRLLYGRMHGLRRNGSAWESRELLRAVSMSRRSARTRRGALRGRSRGGALYQVADAAGTKLGVDGTSRPGRRRRRGGAVHVGADARKPRYDSRIPRGDLHSRDLARCFGRRNGVEQLGAGRQTDDSGSHRLAPAEGACDSLLGRPGRDAPHLASGASAGDAAFASARTTAPSGFRARRAGLPGSQRERGRGSLSSCSG